MSRGCLYITGWRWEKSEALGKAAVPIFKWKALTIPKCFDPKVTVIGRIEKATAIISKHYHLTQRSLVLNGNHLICFNAYWKCKIQKQYMHVRDGWNFSCFWLPELKFPDAPKRSLTRTSKRVSRYWLKLHSSACFLVFRERETLEGLPYAKVLWSEICLPSHRTALHAVVKFVTASTSSTAAAKASISRRIWTTTKQSL